MNVCVLIGRLTRDPKYSTGKKENKEYTVASFYLAVPRSFSKDCSFIKVTSFGKTAEFVKNYLCKGKKIAVRGELVTSNYKDEKTGQTVYTTEIHAQEIEFADKKDKENADKMPPPCPDDGFNNIPDEAFDGLPFR